MGRHGSGSFLARGRKLSLTSSPGHHGRRNDRLGRLRRSISGGPTLRGYPGHGIISCKPILASAHWRSISDSFLSLDSPNQLEYFDFLSDVLELLGSDALSEVLAQEPTFRR
jgi:hypothetical protein